MTDLSTMEKQATDLDAVRNERTKREAAQAVERQRREDEAIERATAQAVAWAKAMRRTFKGIGPTHKRRVANIERAAKRQAQAA